MSMCNFTNMCIDIMCIPLHAHALQPLQTLPRYCDRYQSIYLSCIMIRYATSRIPMAATIVLRPFQKLVLALLNLILPLTRTYASLDVLQADPDPVALQPNYIPTSNSLPIQQGHATPGHSPSCEPLPAPVTVLSIVESASHSASHSPSLLPTIKQFSPVKYLTP
jgi:hypothetical protein